MTALASGRIRVLDAAPDLGAGLTADDLRAATIAATVPAFDVEAGTWTPDALHAEAITRGGVHASLVVGGLVGLQVSLGHRPSTHIYGPGDILKVTGPEPSSLPIELTFDVLVPARIALLDDSFLAAAQRWPRLLERFIKRTTDQILNLSVDQAISQLPHVEDRLLALMWHLADRWGERGGEQIVIQLPLTHEALGRLIGARRPTVSIGLRAMQERGVLSRDTEGHWRLAVSSQDELDRVHRD